MTSIRSCIVGGEPNNLRDFGAEIEGCLGKEKEKNIITTNVAITVPPGLPIVLLILSELINF